MPLETNEPQSEQLITRVGATLREKIEQYAKAEDRSMSAMIRRLLAEAIEAREGK